MLRGHSDRHAFALSRLQKKKDEFLHQFYYQLHFFFLSNQFCLYIHVTELPQTHTQATYNPLAYLLEYHHTLPPTRNPLICFLTNFLSSRIHSPSLCPGNNPFLLKQYTDCLAALCLWSGAGGATHTMHHDCDNTSPCKHQHPLSEVRILTVIYRSTTVMCAFSACCSRIPKSL